MGLTQEGAGGIPATMLVGPANVGGAAYPAMYPYPVYQQGGGNESGNNGFGGQDGWWIVLLIILLAAGNGFGNNNNGGGSSSESYAYLEEAMRSAANESEREAIRQAMNKMYR